MSDHVEEIIINEATGRTIHKGAVVLVARVAGAVLALWFTKRGRVEVTADRVEEVARAS